MAKDHKSFKSLYFCNCRVKKKKKPLILKLIILNYVFLKAKYLLSHGWLFAFNCVLTLNAIKLILDSAKGSQV